MDSLKLVGAAGKGDLSMLADLVVAGVDVNELVNGQSALHNAAYHGQTKSVRFLVESGAEINILDTRGCTPLMVACNAGKVKGSKAAQLLIELGANVNCVRDEDEMTSLKFAMSRGSAELIRNLILSGADIDGPSGTEQTALMIAAVENNVTAAEVLVENGADLSYKSTLPWAKGKNAEEIAVIAKSRKVADFLKACREQP